MPIILIAVAILLAGGGYSAYWLTLKHSTVNAVQEWIAEQRAEGLEIAYRNLAVGGFPFRITADFDRLSVAEPGHPLQWEWHGERLRLVTQPWKLNHIIGLVEGPSQVRYGLPGARETLDVDAERVRFSVILDGRFAFDRASAEAVALAVAPADGAGEALRVGRLEAHARTAPVHGGYDAALRLEALELAGNGPAVLGPRIERAVLDTTFNGRMPNGNLASALAAWRDDGGTLDINAADIRWGPLNLSGDGTVTLDDQMRPLAATTAAIAGYGEMVDAFAAAGQLSSREATAAKLVLTLLSEVPDDGGPRRIVVPVTAQDGIVTIGPVPVAKLAPIAPNPH